MILLENSWEYDAVSVTRGIKNFMKVRVKLEVHKPLKRKKGITIGQNETTYAKFQLEKLSLFWYLCGKLGYGEGFYLVRLTFIKKLLLDGIYQ